MKGLSDAERQQFDQELLRFILDDLMPWHGTAGQDFSLLEGNRYLRNSSGYKVMADGSILILMFCSYINRVRRFTQEVFNSLSS